MYFTMAATVRLTSENPPFGKRTCAVARMVTMELPSATNWTPPGAGTDPMSFGVKGICRRRSTMASMVAGGTPMAASTAGCAVLTSTLSFEPKTERQSTRPGRASRRGAPAGAPSGAGKYVP